MLRSCCFASVTAEEAEDHDYLFRSSEGLRASMASLAASNTSMDVAEWASLSHLNHIPKQILWASGWSKEWQREGEQLAGALPGASFHSHHGSRWPQVRFSSFYISILQPLPFITSLLLWPGGCSSGDRRTDYRVCEELTYQQAWRAFVRSRERYRQSSIE